MGQIILPSALADGTIAYGSEVRANDEAIVAQLRQLDRFNIDPAADIPGTYLSATPGDRIPADRLETGAVDERVLKDDSASGAPAAAVNRQSQIRNGIITPNKLAGGIGSAGLKMRTLRYQLGAVSIVDGGRSTFQVTSFGLFTTGVQVLHATLGKYTPFSTPVVPISALERELTVHHLSGIYTTQGGAIFEVRRQYRPTWDFAAQTITDRPPLDLSSWFVDIFYVAEHFNPGD